MVSLTKVYEKPVLTNPVLIEGLPGIGFVANIAALHLIRELKAKVFAEIHSSSFQDFATTTDRGEVKFPINELYYHKGRNREKDLVILYGNTQALTTVGQYELCGHILNVAEEVGCQSIITLGGLKVDRKVDVPKLYCAASDQDTLAEVLNLGAKIIGGPIFGVAGLLVGLATLRGLKGFSLLAETLGLYPDAVAAREILKAIGRTLHLEVDLSRLDVAVEATRATLEFFGFASPPVEKKTKEDARYRGII